MKNVSITLNKANQILRKLNHGTNYDLDPIHQASLGYDFSITDDPEQVKQEIILQFAEFETSLTNMMNFTRDYFALKSAIFKYNVELGLSEVLSKLDRFRKERAMWMSVLEMVKNVSYKDYESIIPAEDYISNIQENSKKNELTDCRLNIRFIKPEEAKKFVRISEQSINQLEDEKTRLNAETITVELSESTLEFLGM